MLTGIIGVQNGGNCLGVGAVAVGTRVIAGVEGFKIEVHVDGLCAPAAQFVHRLSAVADDRDVVGDGKDVLGVLNGIDQTVTFLTRDDVPAKADANRLVRALDLPWIALGEPLIGDFHLASVNDLLLEQAVAVAHAVTVARDALVCHGVEEAGGETAEAAVAERRVGLLALDLVEIAAHVGDGVGDEVADAEVEQVVVEQAPDEELDREIIDALLPFYAIALVGLGGDDARIARDHLGESGEPVDIARALKFLARKSAHMLAILLGELFFALVDLVHGFLSGSGWEWSPARAFGPARVASS